MAAQAIRFDPTSRRTLWRMLVGIGAFAACTGAVCLVVLGDLRDAPSSTILVACSISATLLAPLFWPLTGSSARPVVSLLAWCCVVPLVATAVVSLLSVRLPPIEALAASAVLTGVMALAMHTTLIALAYLRGGTRIGPATSSVTEAARILVISTFAAASLAPVWLGPAAELAGNSSALPSFAVGVSPLMHIADAARCDLLRQNWFYAHSNLGALRVNYLPWKLAAAVYLCIAAILAVLIGLRLAAIRSSQSSTLAARPEDVSCVQ